MQLTFRTWILFLTLAGLCLAPLPSPGEERPRSTVSLDETSAMRPSSAMLAVWTDRLGYFRRDLIQVFLTMDPMDDATIYSEFTYLENLDTGERMYLPRKLTDWQLQDTMVDVGGRGPLVFGEHPIAALPPTRIWSGFVPEPGLWQFVAEIRSPDGTEAVKTAYAKFIVSASIPVVLGGGGKPTEIATDTTWTRDRMYALRHQVFVNAGATLTIEPGTLVLGSGPSAAIVVEQGGRIVAEGRRDAPIVMTCDQPVGQRFPGCWGGLFLLGGAPVTRNGSIAGEAVPDARALFGGHDPADSSGVLRYVRVEFAGAGGDSREQASGIGLYGVGSRTVIDHVQAHASAGDGIAFVGGTANCTYCVSSGAGDDALDWSRGWRGTAQFVFLHQSPAEGNHGIEGDNDELGFDATPRSLPQLYNVTMVGGMAQGFWSRTTGCGLLLRRGSAVKARNVVITGFGQGAIVVRDNCVSLFADGTSSIANTIVRDNPKLTAYSQIKGGVEQDVEYVDADPLLVNMRYEPNPDPRPTLGSLALAVESAATPPSDGVLDTSARCVGAFCSTNWLEEWTFFGDEAAYSQPE